MKNLILIAVAVSLTLALTLVGCSTCAAPNDYDYPAYGGKHLRTDRRYGRVGSILSDPATTLTGPSADSNLKPPPEPLAVTPDVEDIEAIDDIEEVDLSTDEDDLEGFDPGRDDDLLDDLEEDLEPIEPLRNDIDGSGTKPSGSGSKGDDSTASSRWRPRPLR